MILRKGCQPDTEVKRDRKELFGDQKEKEA